MFLAQIKRISKQSLQIIEPGALFVVSGLLLIHLLPARLEAAEQKRWADEAELSFVQTGGNTDVTTFSGKNKLSHQFSENWSAVWKAAALYGQTDNVKTADRYETDLRLDYAYSERTYAYASAGWLQDKFAGFDQRYWAGPGAGYRFLTGPRHILSSELGANYAREFYTDDTETDFVEGRAYAKYEYVFNDNVKFTQQLEYLQNFQSIDKYKLKSTTDLLTRLTDRFSIKASYEIRYDNQPTPEDENLKNTDTLLSVSLVVNL